jgi:hypothetical protein
MMESIRKSFKVHKVLGIHKKYLNLQNFQKGGKHNKGFQNKLNQ